MKILKIWLPLAFGITAMSGLIYVAVQQDLRMSANDPQIQMAEDTANDLSMGATPISVLPQNPVDISKSLATFMIIYDSSGKVTASSVTLNNQTPKLPEGVFTDANNKNELRFTWQPQAGVRIAAVVTKYEGRSPGFVLAGRSIREVEKREDSLLRMAGLVWLAAILGTFILIMLIPRKKE